MPLTRDVCGTKLTIPMSTDLLESIRERAHAARVSRPALVRRYIADGLRRDRAEDR
jgi:hypothetical protein